jgi:uncharacterized protein YlxP (DUF503 family)
MSLESVTLGIDLHIPEARSLKAKRSVVQSIVRTLDGWTGVGAAEVDHVELWQRSLIAACVVGNGTTSVEERASAVERYIWSRHDVEVLEISWTWLER